MAGQWESLVKLKGDWVGRLGTLRIDQDSDGAQIIRGELYKYIQLDSTRDWFNVQKGKPAEQRELESIQIPDHLKPHFQYVPFVFYPNGHRLILVTRDGRDVISTGQAVLILEAAFSVPEIVRIFGRMELVVEPARDTLERILSMPRLRTLEIFVTPPNPDDLEEFEQGLFKEMDAQRASAYHLILNEVSGQGLAPNDRTRKIAQVAQSNGKVSGIGGSRGKTDRLSTTEHPFIAKAQYDPDVEARGNVLLNKAKEIFRQLRGK